MAKREGVGMRLLVSGAGPDDARAALAGGADVIDAKAPGRGALGPVGADALAAIRRTVGPARPVSAALGDARAVDAIERAARAVARVGLAFVKVGFAGVTDAARAREFGAAVQRGAGPGTGVVLVAYADWRRAPRSGSSRSATSSWPRSSSVTIRCSTPRGSARRKYASTTLPESQWAGLISTTRRAASAPATQAAMLSLVTSQECGSGSAARSQR